MEKSNKLNLIGDNNRIGFIYNAKEIRFGDQTPVEKYFKSEATHQISVYETRDIL